MLDPPKRLLDAIEFNGLSIELRFPTFDKSSQKRILAILELMSGIFEECFGDASKPFLAKHIFIEVLTNAAGHGNQWDPNKDIVVGLWIGEKGVLFGVLDEGDFFKKQSTIEKIKKRKPFSSTRKEEGGGVGIVLGLYSANGIQIKEGAVFFNVLLREKR